MIPLHPFSCSYSALKISANKIAIKLATNINIEDKEVGIKGKKKCCIFYCTESTSRVVVPTQRSRSILVAKQEFNP